MNPWRNYKPVFKNYKAKSRFNLLFSVEDLQGDGFVRLTLVLFHQAIQVFVPFNNTKRVEYEWRWKNLYEDQLCTCSFCLEKKIGHSKPPCEYYEHHCSFCHERGTCTRADCRSKIDGQN